MGEKIKTFLIGLLYENNEPSLTRFFLLIGFLLCWIALYIAMFVVIQNASIVISTIGNIIVTILGVKGLQATVKNIIGGVFESKKDEPYIGIKNPQ